MNKQIYMKRLSRTLFWRLPKNEAAEVLSDYMDILSNKPEELNDAHIKELGEPAKAAALVTESRKYHCWLVAFGAMATCILLPLPLLLRRAFYHEPTFFIWCMFLIGAGTSLIWFRHRSGEKNLPLPKSLRASLVGLTALLILSGAFLLGLAFGIWQIIPSRLYGTIACFALLVTGSIAAVAGMFGLVNARLTDWRWRALYVFGLTVLLECILVLSLLTGMDTSTTVPNWWVEYVVRWSLLGSLGLVGTGVSLC